MPSHRTTFFFCVTTAVATLVSSMAIPAQADAAAQDGAAVLLDEIVVTAPEMSEPLTIVTDPKAPRQPVPAHDGADYLKNIPGLSVIRKGGTDGDPVLRGLAGSRLNIQMDGQSVLGGCGMRMDPPTAYVFPEAYDRIAVLKGPQTVLYGGGNLAGTALFERDTRLFDAPGMRSFAGVLTGGFGRSDQVVDITGGTRHGFARATGTRSTMGNYEDGDGREVHSAYTRWNMDLVGGWTPDENTRIELSLDRSDGEAAYADRAMDGVLFDRTGYAAKYTGQNLSPRIQKLEAQVYRNYVDHAMDNFSLRPKTAPMYMVYNPDRTTDGARVAGEFALPGSTAFTLGFDYQKNVHTLRSASDMMAPPDIEAETRAPDITFENGGMFAEVRQVLDERNRLLAGARLDRLRVNNEKTTGTGALASITNETYGGFVRYEHEADGTTTYVGLGHAERAADWWERSTYQGFYLDPEKSNQLDVGAIHAGARWRAAVSAFYAAFDDFILTRNDSTARNIDATTWGAEADAARALGGPWRVTGTLAWVRGTNDTDGVALAQMSPLEGRLGVQYDDRTWSFGGLMRMASEQDRVHVGYGNIVGQDIGRTPGYAVFSLNAGWRPRKDALITAGIDNVTDRTYAEHLSRAGTAVAGFEQTARVNEPGRNLWLKANIAFN